MSVEEEELRRLLVAALDNEASETQLARLNALLRGSESLRRSAARFLRDDSILKEEIGAIEEALVFLRQASAPPSALAERGAAASQAPVTLRLSGGDAPRDTADRSAGRSAWHGVHATLAFVNSHGLALAAASIVAAAAFYWHYAAMMARFDRLYSLAGASDSVQRQRAEGAARGARTSPGAAGVARVTGLVDCEWEPGEPILKFGDQLAPGQRLRMTSGRLQLTYDAGAKLTIEGPADFVATMPSEARLAHGKIAAAVPRAARGYTILTPTAEVVDLGTEFGVSVDSSGASEVHVFDGDVVTRALGRGAADGELIHARKDQAVRFEGESHAPTRFSADRQMFVRRIIPEVPKEKLPPLPLTDRLVLWLAADTAPSPVEGGSVSTWPDILTGDNQFPDDAWQFDDRRCPIWVRDEKGRPAVRFDGWSSYLATSPIETGNRQTAFVVFSPSPVSFASSSHGGMLLKYGLEAPSLELAVLPNHSPRGLVWASDGSGNTSNMGVIAAAPVKPFAPCAVAYVYDAESNRAELITNGRSAGVASAPQGVKQRAKKYIGSHAEPWYEAYFLGNIYEVIVYDVALGEAEREQIFQYLSDRYAISLAK